MPHCITTFLSTTLGIIFLLGPWVLYVTLVMWWPVPIDQGCYSYQCTYGININLSQAFWMYTPYVNGTFVSIGCSSGISTQCDGKFNVNGSDPLAILEWILTKCYPVRNSERLYNNTPCYSGTGQDNVGVDQFGYATCPYRTTCYNLYRDSVRDNFLWIYPMAVFGMQILVCWCWCRCLSRDEPNESDPLIQA